MCSNAHLRRGPAPRSRSPRCMTSPSVSATRDRTPPARTVPASRRNAPDNGGSRSRMLILILAQLGLAGQRGQRRQARARVCNELRKAARRSRRRRIVVQVGADEDVDDSRRLYQPVSTKDALLRDGGGARRVHVQAVQALATRRSTLAVLQRKEEILRLLDDSDDGTVKLSIAGPARSRAAPRWARDVTVSDQGVGPPPGAIADQHCGRLSTNQELMDLMYDLKLAVVGQDVDTTLSYKDFFVMEDVDAASKVVQARRSGDDQDDARNHQRRWADATSSSARERATNDAAAASTCAARRRRNGRIAPRWRRPDGRSSELSGSREERTRAPRCCARAT